jgi:hypothetical protein
MEGNLATVTENIDLPVQWDVASAVAAITSRINHAKQMATRRYIFIGETHASRFDKSRNHQLGFAFAGDNDVILITERSIWNDPRPANQFLARTLNEPADNMWQEPTHAGVGSFDDSRNVETADEIVRRVQLDDVANPYHPKPVVIIFGEDHNARIREKLVTRLADDVRICWWSAKSIMEYYDTLPARLPAALGNVVCVGFYRARDDDDQQVQFLTKGKITAPFTVTLHDERGPGAGATYAMFLQANNPQVATTLLRYYNVNNADVTFSPNGGGLPNCAAELVSHGRYDILVRQLRDAVNADA